MLRILERGFCIPKVVFFVYGENLPLMKLRLSKYVGISGRFSPESKKIDFCKGGLLPKRDDFINLCTKKWREVIVRPAVAKSLEPKEYRGSTLLWASEIGGCPRKSLFRILGFKSEKEFPLELLEKFQFGKVLEDDTGRMLKEMYGNRLTNQLELRTKVWSGKCDWGLDVGRQNPILIEHKATGSKWWGKYESPPQDSHLAQLILYGQLYEEKYGIKPRLVLYYRAWSNWAELVLRDLGERVEVTGVMDGSDFRIERLMNVTQSRVYLEKYFSLQELPPYRKEDECFFAGEPSCAYFNQCHENQPNQDQSAKWGLF